MSETPSISSGLISEIGTVAGQIGSAITSAAEPITAIAGAIGNVAKDIQPLENPTTLQRVNQLTEGAQNDVADFKNKILSGDWAGIRSAIGGLRGTIGIKLSSAEFDALAKIGVQFSGNDLLGFYDAARTAKLEADSAQVESLNK